MSGFGRLLIKPSALGSTSATDLSCLRSRCRQHCCLCPLRPLGRPRIAKRWSHPEILDPIDSTCFVHRSSKKEEKGEKHQGRNHDAEADGKNYHRVKWSSVGN